MTNEGEEDGWWMTDVGIEPPLCHPHKCLVGIHLKGNEDECLMTIVGHVGGRLRPMRWRITL